MNISNYSLILVGLFLSTLVRAQVCPTTITIADTIFNIQQIPADESLTFEATNLEHLQIENNGVKEMVTITLCGTKTAAIAAYQIENNVNVGYSVPVSKNCSTLDLEIQPQSKSYYLRLSDAQCQKMAKSQLSLKKQSSETTIKGKISDVSGTATGNWDLKDLEYERTNLGEYKIDKVQSGSQVVVEPFRIDPAPIYEDLSVRDIVLVVRHILEKETFGSPLQLLAADVDENNAITVSDLQVIQQILLRNNATFPNGNGSYRYYLMNEALQSDSFSEILINASQKLQVVGGSQDSIEANFVEVKLGDVSSWDNSPLVNNRSLTSLGAIIEDNTMQLELPKAQEAFELKIRFDKGLTPTIDALPNSAHNIYEEDGQTVLHLLYLDGIHEVIETLKVGLSGQITTENELPFQIESFMGIKASQQTDYTFKKIEPLKVSNVYPTPSNGEAYIDIELEDVQQTDIQIFNALGQVIETKTIMLSAGKHTIQLPSNNSLKIVKIQTAIGHKTKRYY